jgi:hypothetical protein
MCGVQFNRESRYTPRSFTTSTLSKLLAQGGINNLLYFFLINTISFVLLKFMLNLLLSDQQMAFSNSVAEQTTLLDGHMSVTSSAYLTIIFSGYKVLKSDSIIENRYGPRTEPCTTP